MHFIRSLLTNRDQKQRSLDQERADKFHESYRETQLSGDLQLTYQSTLVPPLRCYERASTILSQFERLPGVSDLFPFKPVHVTSPVQARMNPFAKVPYVALLKTLDGPDGKAFARLVHRLKALKPEERTFVFLTLIYLCFCLRLWPARLDELIEQHCPDINLNTSFTQEGVRDLYLWIGGGAPPAEVSTQPLLSHFHVRPLAPHDYVPPEELTPEQWASVFTRSAFRPAVKWAIAHGAVVDKACLAKLGEEDAKEIEGLAAARRALDRAVKRVVVDSYLKGRATRSYLRRQPSSDLLDLMVSYVAWSTLLAPP